MMPLCYSGEAVSDCAVSWTIEETDSLTPNLIEMTQPTDLSTISAGTNDLVLTSTDFSDVGTHSYTYSCFYTNYPDTKVSATVTLTVYDCDDSSSATHSNDNSCACAKLDGLDGWTTANWELVDPSVAVELFTKIEAISWFDRNGMDSCWNTGTAGALDTSSDCTGGTGCGCEWYEDPSNIADCIDPMRADSDFNPMRDCCVCGGGSRLCVDDDANGGDTDDQSICYGGFGGCGCDWYKQNVDQCG